VATIRDVAKQAQVSVGTVSRVMNDHPSVSPAIRRAVLDAVAALHFQPNAIARTLRTARTQTLALLMSSMRNADLAFSAIRGAEDGAYEHGYALFVANSRGDPRVEERLLKNLVARRVDGLLCNPRMPIEKVHALVQRAGVPTVVYGRASANGPLPTAVLDFAAATEEAIDHLLALGHRRIGTVTDAGQRSLEVNLAWGVRFIHRALVARGIEIDPRHHPVVRSTEECTQVIRALFLGRQHPTAMLITPLYLAPATIAGMRAAGAQLGRKVSVIGFGDAAWTQVLEPPLSVVAADLTAHFKAAARLLVSAIAGEADVPAVVETHARYLRRGSVQPAHDRCR
jgi:LacI family transcriptional regulator